MPDWLALRSGRTDDDQDVVHPGELVIRSLSSPLFAAVLLTSLDVAAGVGVATPWLTDNSRYTCDCSGSGCVRDQCGVNGQGLPVWCTHCDPGSSDPTCNDTVVVVTACPGVCSSPGTSCADPNNPCDESICVAAPGGSPTYSSSTSSVSNLPQCIKRNRCGGGGAPEKAPADNGVCRQPGFGQSGGSNDIGDPISADTGLTKHGHVDVRLPAVETEFQFTRFYTASETFWTRYGGTHGLAPPFGTNSSQVLNWSHSLFSFIAPNGTCAVTVRRTDGSVIEFDGCAQGFMTPDEEALELGARLRRDSNGFVLFDGNRTFDYSTEHGGLFLLTRITDAIQSPQRPAIAELQYGDWGCGPIVSQVLVGGQFYLDFSYMDVSDVGGCVLSTISWANEVVTYEYDPTYGLTRAYGTAFDETFTAPLGTPPPGTPRAFTAMSYDGQRVRHEYGSVAGQTRVVALKESVDGQNLVLRDSFVSATCAPLTSCLATRYNYQRTGSFVGDGNRTPAAAEPYFVDGVYTEANNFRSTNSSAPGRVMVSSFGSPSASPRPASVATIGPAGSRTSNWSSSGNSRVPNLVTTQVDEHGRLTTLTWEFGANETPLLKTLSAPSVLDPTKQAVTTYSWDTTKLRLKAQFRAGRTRAFGPQWKEGSRVVATFYRTESACSPSGADPLDRTVEIHGPCFVSGTSATSCDPGQKFLVRSITYGDPTTIMSTTDYPNAEETGTGISCGTGLTTTFGPNNTGHYPWWNPAAPGSVTTPDGVTTQLGYYGGRLTSISRGMSQHVWELDYDADKPTRVLTPDGYWLVTCYRPYTISGGCDMNGALRTKPTAFVVADNADGINPSEALLFDWAPDGTLVESQTIDQNGTVHRREAFESTSAGDLTFRALGQAGVGGNYAATFDDAHRMIGFGEEYTQPIPAFCGRPPGSTAPISGCSAVTWDGFRVSRIEGSAVGDTCIHYDDDGNVEKVESNCGGAKKTRGDYTTDDFGNVVESTVSLRGTQTVTTRMEYDAQGNVVRRQSPEMENVSVLLKSTWDGLGRLLKTERVSTSVGGSETLVVQEWDQASISPCAAWCPISYSCVANHQRAGRLAYRSDATGETWFNYNEAGQLAAEIVRPRNESSCSEGHSRTYAYYPDGTPWVVRYPFGRTVTYVRNPGERRPSSVQVSFFDGSSWVDETVLDDIHWVPFGGLEYYRIRVPGADGFASVDYREGQTTAWASTEQCSDSPLGEADQTGRVRALVVKRSEDEISYQDRTAGDHVFSTRYSYEGNELAASFSCLLSGTEVLYEGRSYGNGALGLTTRSIPGESAWGGRVYGSPTPLINQNTLTPWEEFRTIHLDRSVSEWWGNPQYKPNMYRELPDFAYCEPNCVQGYRVESVDPVTGERQVERRDLNANGQVKDRTAWWGSTELWREDLVSDPGTSGFESVYRWVQNETGSYEYFYDADNRRRIKVYESGEQDEFFYRPASTELLTDLGNSEVFYPQAHPTDDYVWLGGRPVVVVRGRLDAQMQRMSDHDDPADCGRNGSSITPSGVTVGSACGLYFPVSDPQGRIAVMLDQGRFVAGVGESDPYGNVNQVDVAVGSDHPYSSYFHLQRDLIPAFQHTPWAPEVTDVRMRLHFFAVDVEQSDDAWVEDSGGNTIASALERCQTIGSTPCGENMGRVTTFWGKPEDGRSFEEMRVRFRSGPQTSTPMYGVSLDRIEYLRHEKSDDVRPWWPPLRLPGQYFDEETGLFENWNRFLDGQTGRYLSPEPLLQSPRWVRGQARHGFGAPTYAYARNNPVRYTDPDGLQVPGPGAIPVPIPRPIPWPTFGPPSPWTFILPALLPGTAHAPDCPPGGCGRPVPAPPNYPAPTWPRSPSIPDFCKMVATSSTLTIECTESAVLDEINKCLLRPDRANCVIAVCDYAKENCWSTLPHEIDKYCVDPK